MRYPVFLAAAGLLGAVSSQAADSNKLLDTWESGTFSLLPRSFQKDPHLDVMIVTEFTAAGRKAPQASIQHPVYYIGKNGGQQSAGDVIAGERPPSDEYLNRMLTRTLAANGYLAASKAHPPMIYIFYRWGSFNQLSAIDDPTGANGPQMEPMDDQQYQNLLQRAALVGGEKFAVDLSRAVNAGLLTQFEHRSARNEFLMQQVYSNRYYVIATAYDMAAAMHGKQLPLWRTKISTDANGIEMDDSVPGLIAVSGPYFGHETDGAVRLNRQVVQPGHVEIGTPIVKADLPSDAPLPQVSSAAPSSASTPSAQK